MASIGVGPQSRTARNPGCDSHPITSHPNKETTQTATTTTETRITHVRTRTKLVSCHPRRGEVRRAERNKSIVTWTAHNINTPVDTFAHMWHVTPTRPPSHSTNHPITHPPTSRKRSVFFAHFVSSDARNTNAFALCVPKI